MAKEKSVEDLLDVIHGSPNRRCYGSQISRLWRGDNAMGLQVQDSRFDSEYHFTCSEKDPGVSAICDSQGNGKVYKAHICEHHN